jgi:long-chain acyl-CoA synthetase
MLLAGPPLDHPVDLGELIGPGLASRPDEEALVSAESRWTWRELERGSARLAANFLSLGLRPGDRVASLMPNRTALLVHYLGCIKAGLVTVPLNYRYTHLEIDHALKVSGATLLLAHAERDEDIAASRLASRLPHGVISFGARDGRSPSFEQLIEPMAADVPLDMPDPAAPGFIFFTSGSTGPAKGVTHSFETLGWMLAATAGGFELTADDVMLPGSSCSHLGGFLFSLAALSVGARVVVARSLVPDQVLPLLREARPTVLCMLPAALFGIVRDHGATPADFASLRLCRSGSDKVPAELEREFTDLTGLEIDEGYGCTETGLATLNPPSGTIKLGSIGRPNPGYTLSIRDEDGRELPPGADGRLWIRSASNMVGYWNDPAATAATLRDGWLDTGDLMMADEDGYLWFRGRKKQIIVHDGSNICPQEVEEALLEHRAVASAGVVGVHDLLHGENVRAYVTFRDGAARPTSRELIRFARARISYKAPEEIAVLDRMPLNPTGKIDRVALKRMAEERLAVGDGLS